ncbi:MAG TPA: glucose 1-dehydrogenase [Vicinamibacterales bacterium]|nr:glucose 1-dehydrogenase [Vicinamibacterales bacterium]
MFDLTTKTALVTGAGSGIGAAIASTFAAAGARVFVTDRTAAAARATAATLPDHAIALALDVTDEAQCSAAASEVLAGGRALDVLVNCAGIGHVGTILETGGVDLDRLYAVNVRGVFNVSKAFVPSMIQRRAGSIINVASVGGIVGIRDRVAYCTSKFAVVGLTKSMALDHALAGVRVNCICPGRVETPFVAKRLAEYADPEQARRDMTASQAVGRMGRPDEIAAAALYLASDESAFITGSALMIDGGWSAGK